MKTYIRLSDNAYPLYPGDVRLEHPNLPEDFESPEGFAEVVWVEPAPVNLMENTYQVRAEVVDGVLQTVWNVIPRPQEYIDAMRQEIEKQNSLPFNITASGSAPDVIG